jgi:hypothetical protein
MRDRHTGVTSVVSVGLGGQPSNGPSPGPRCSEDGSILAFQSTASNLVMGDNNGKSDVFFRDLVAGTTTRVSVNSAGGEGNDMSWGPAISPDGRYIGFMSLASNLVPGDSNGYIDAFRHDRLTNSLERISVDTNGVEGDWDSGAITLSRDSRRISFLSRAHNLVPNDTNGTWDAFVREYICTPPVVYCTAKVNSLGCTPQIGFTGAPSATASNGFVLSGTNVRNNKAGLLIYTNAGRDAAPFQGGFLCVAQPIKRSIAINSNGTPAPANDCSGAYVLDMNAFGSSALGGSPAPYLRVAGTVVDVQCWGRDNGFPAPGNSTLTNGLEFTVCPR